MRRRAFGRRTGFTLMEVMVTLGILGVGLFVLFNAFHSSMRLRDLTLDEVIQRELVQRAAGLAEVEVLSGTLSDSGEFGPRYPGYTWAFDAVLAAGDDGLVQLYEVEITVSGPEDDRTLRFLVYNTSAEDAPGVQAGAQAGAGGRAPRGTSPARVQPLQDSRGITRTTR